MKFVRLDTPNVIARTGYPWAAVASGRAVFPLSALPLLQKGVVKGCCVKAEDSFIEAGEQGLVSELVAGDYSEIGETDKPLRP